MMARKETSVRILLVLNLLAAAASGEETWFETRDGLTYRVTRRVEKVPVAETRTEPRGEPIVNTEYETEMRETTRAVWVPVTRYVTQPRQQPWWNPFAPPQTGYETRPVTQWELQTQTVREPVTRKKEVRHERIVRVPVRSLGFVEKEYEERVVVNLPAGSVPTGEPTGAPNRADVQYAERAAPAIRSADASRGGLPATTLGGIRR